jgi:hypothetical protein
VRFERPVDGVAEGDKRRERGGLATGVPRGAQQREHREGGGTDRWAMAQCRAAVPLIGGSGHSARARVGRPEKKAGWPSPDEQYDFAFI